MPCIDFTPYLDFSPWWVFMTLYHGFFSYFSVPFEAKNHPHQNPYQTIQLKSFEKVALIITSGSQSINQSINQINRPVFNKQINQSMHLKSDMILKFSLKLFIRFATVLKPSWTTNTSRPFSAAHSSWGPHKMAACPTRTGERHIRRYTWSTGTSVNKRCACTDYFLTRASHTSPLYV